MAKTALDHFAKIDAHAAQYSMISNSLLATAVEYLEKKEVQERLQRTESSAQLFGLIPHGAREMDRDRDRDRDKDSINVRTRSPELARKAMASPNLRMGLKGGPDTAYHGEPYAESHPAHGSVPMGSPYFSDLDPAFLTMSASLPRTPDLSLMSGVFDGDESSFGGLNLFPLLETGGGGGHIDLAHYL